MIRDASLVQLLKHPLHVSWVRVSVSGSLHHGLVVHPRPRDTVVLSEGETPADSEQQPAAEGHAQSLQHFLAFDGVGKIGNSWEAWSLECLSRVGMLCPLNPSLEPVPDDDGATVWMAWKAGVQL